MSFSSFLSRLSGFSGLFLLVLALSNFYLAFRASSVINMRSVTVTNVVEVAYSVPVSDPTNPPSPSVESPSIRPASSSHPDRPASHEVAQWPYRYFTINRRVGFEIFGRYYYEGSPCSWGRIKEIYPDRILLSSGDWISNRFSNDVARKDDRK